MNPARDILREEYSVKEKSSFARYGITLAVMLSFLTLKFVFPLRVDFAVTLLGFGAAIFFITYFLGRGPGYVALTVSVLETIYIFNGQIMPHEQPHLILHTVSLVSQGVIQIYFVSRRRDAIDRLQVVEKVKDDFMAIASHELKTPLTSLKLYAQMLHQKAHGPKYSAFHKIAERLDDQITRLTSIINDFVNVAKINAGKFEMRFEEVDVRELILHCIDVSRGELGNRELITNIDTCPNICADRERFVHVVTNLIQNAIKYSEDGTRIRIHVSHEEGSVVISVSDEGRGIPPDQLFEIFRKEYRIKRGSSVDGMGLGLFIAQEIVKAHNGTIWAESEGDGKGSTFYVLVPCV